MKHVTHMQLTSNKIILSNSGVRLAVVAQTHNLHILIDDEDQEVSITALYYLTIKRYIEEKRDDLYEKNAQDNVNIKCV